VIQIIIIKINEQYLRINNTQIYTEDGVPEIHVEFNGHQIEEIININQIIELWSVFNSNGLAQYFKTEIKSASVDESSLDLELKIIGKPPLGVLNELETIKQLSKEVIGTVTLKE